MNMAQQYTLEPMTLQEQLGQENYVQKTVKKNVKNFANKKISYIFALSFRNERQFFIVH